MILAARADAGDRLLLVDHPLEILNNPAPGEPRATPELLASFRAGLSRADHQCTSTLRAQPLGSWVAAAFEVLQVLTVCGERGRTTAALEKL